MKFNRLLGVLFISFATGCSYQFGNIKRGIPGGYNKIAVPMFSNSTSEPGVEPYFTGALVEEIERGHAVNVTQLTDAHVVIDGAITSIRLEQGAVVDVNTYKNLKEAVMAKEYRLIVTSSVALRRISDNMILWSGEFKGEQRFAAALVTSDSLNSANPLYNQSAKHLTLKVLARTMMAEAHDRMTENF